MHQMDLANIKQKRFSGEEINNELEKEYTFIDGQYIPAVLDNKLNLIQIFDWVEPTDSFEEAAEEIDYEGDVVLQRVSGIWQIIYIYTKEDWEDLQDDLPKKDDEARLEELISDPEE